MPNDKEIDEVLGEENGKKTEEIKNDEKPSDSTVSVEEYRKVVQNYENLRSLSDRKDAELARLRQVTKVPKKVEPVEEDEDEEPDEETRLRDRLIAMGFAPKEEVEKEVEKRVAIENQIKTLQEDIKDAVKNMSFVNERAVFDKINEKKGNLSVKEAIQLLYPTQLSKYQSSDDLVETDFGGRTIKVSPEETSSEAPVKRGFAKGSDFRDSIMKRVTNTVQKELAGK